MSRLTMLIVSAALLVIPSASSAQRTGSRMGTSIPRTKPELVFDAVSKCYLGKYAKKAAEHLQTVPGSAAERQSLNAMTGSLDICMADRDLVFEGQELTFDPQRLRRALATGLVRKNPETISASAPIAPVNAYWTPDKLLNSAVFDKQAVSITHFAQCVVVKDWEAAKNLVLAKESSTEAKAAEKKIRPAMQSCVALGSNLKIDKRLLAHVVGEGLYYQSILNGGKLL